ncbi:hypothetical protein BGZ83_005539, partial [Gryganskiella cystojenkinii]
PANKRQRNGSAVATATPALKKTKSSGSQLDLPRSARKSAEGRPANVATLNDHHIVDIAAGGLHNMALTASGKLWSWGVNDQKTLGRSGDEFTPLPVEGLDDVRIVKVACSDSLTVALSEEGDVYTWGTFRSAEGILGHSKDKEVQDLPTKVNHLANVVDIATGTDHVLALDHTGAIFSWGNGQQKQLGRRIVARRILNGLTPESVGSKRFVKVGAGAYHSFGIDKDGKAYAWGLNTYGQCGNDDVTVDEVPSVAPIDALKDIKIQDIQGGEHHTIALTQEGKLYGFGRSDSHQLGLGYTEKPGEETTESHKKAIREPTLIIDIPEVKAISVGSNHTLALTRAGEVYAWGFGEMLACGNGKEEDVEKPLKLQGQQVDGVTIYRVAGGGQHSVLLGAPST